MKFLEQFTLITDIIFGLMILLYLYQIVYIAAVSYTHLDVYKRQKYGSERFDDAVWRYTRFTKDTEKKEFVC